MPNPSTERSVIDADEPCRPDLGEIEAAENSADLGGGQSDHALRAVGAIGDHHRLVAGPQRASGTLGIQRL